MSTEKNEDYESNGLLHDSDPKESKEKHYPERKKVSGKAWGRVWCKFFRLPFPVFFIVWNEFCERFSYYGMRAILTLFLKNFLGFGDDTATAIYHSFIVMCYLTPLGGAIISDSCLGKYSTIVSLSIVYAIGNIMMSISAIPFGDSRGTNIGLSAVALLIIAAGTGGIKPCVAAFGGDQFRQDKIYLLPVFFSVFYFSINAGSVLSTILTPILRSYVQCFGEDTCFPLAFGVPAMLMIVSLVIFIFGTRWYFINRPKREAALIFLQVPASFFYAIYRRITLGKVPGMRNFMDYAAPKYSEKFVFDVYLFLRVVVMLLPLPVFWMLFDQQGSRWTLQALRMDGRFGKFVIEPDQVQVLNPVFIIILIPVFETVVYPVFGYCKLLKKPLQRMVAGMVLAGIAFFIAGILEIYIQSSSDHLRKGEARVTISNTLPEPLLVQFGSRDVVNLTDSTYMVNTKNLDDTILNITTLNGIEYSQKININESEITQLFISSVEGDIEIYGEGVEEWFPDGDKASIRLFVGDVDDLFPSGLLNISLCEKSCKSISDGKYQQSNIAGNTYNPNTTDLAIGKYRYLVESSGGQQYSGSLPSEFGPSGIYTVVLTKNKTGDGVEVRLSAANSPNQVSVLLQAPMYVIITAGEVLFSITGLEFAYSQAPPTMKSLCQAAWLLTVAFGNLVVVIVAESSIFDNQAHEFFFFAAATVAIAGLFAVMSYFYKYIDPVKLIADQSGEGYNPPRYDDESGDSILGENKTLLHKRFPNDNRLSDIDTDSPVFEERKIKSSDESEF